MPKVISATGARRKFLKLLRGVRQGQTYIVTRYGRPVARIEPFSKKADASRSKAVLLKRLRAQEAINSAPGLATNSTTRACAARPIRTFLSAPKGSTVSEATTKEGPHPFAFFAKGWVFPSLSSVGLNLRRLRSAVPTLRKKREGWCPLIEMASTNIGPKMGHPAEEETPSCLVDHD